MGGGEDFGSLLDIEFPLFSLVFLPNNPESTLLLDTDLESCFLIVGLAVSSLVLVDSLDICLLFLLYFALLPGSLCLELDILLEG